MFSALPQYNGQRRPDNYLTKRKNSPPAAVRQYLASLLMQNHGRTLEESTEIASYWVYGRGSDFYQYDLDTFKDMFGDEVGMLFYLYSRGLTPGGRLKAWGVFGTLWRVFLCVMVFNSAKDIWHAYY
ncbi:hypothetical protein EAE96_007134 [Botrytis aclada]|nr:hypothetical protein EAE96_007134 [Botrytis aclada]